MYSIEILAGGDTSYRIKLNNNSKVRCDVRLYIDNTFIGIWRVERMSSIIIERPVQCSKKFTYTMDDFLANLTLSETPTKGLVIGYFTPESSTGTIDNSYPVFVPDKFNGMLDFNNGSEACTQRINRVEHIPLDYDKTVATSVRLIS